MPGVAGEYGVAPDDADDAINVLVITAQQQREIGALDPPMMAIFRSSICLFLVASLIAR